MARAVGGDGPDGARAPQVPMAISPPEDSPKPRVVGRYRLVSWVISGALGELWRAKIASGPEEGRAVLIRLIPRSSAVDPRALQRLTNAGFAAMELRHPKIAAVLDVVVADSEIAIVSEHIAGAPLKAVAAEARARRTPATSALALRIVGDVLEALDAVRAPWAELTGEPQSDDERLLASGIHGGVTPDDLLVATFGETMLLEAGLAGVAMTLPAISGHPEVIAYRAPEQIDGKGFIDERADVFTVGVVTWELVTGRPLFGPMLLPRPPPTAAAASAMPRPVALAAQASAVGRKVLSAPIQRLDGLPLLKGKITKELSDWVARCLERDRAARFQTLREALHALQALGPAAMAPPDGVAKWVAASGVSLDLVRESIRAEPAPTSDRPTVPPVEDDASRTSAGVADLTVESLMPSDSVPPPAAPPTSEVREESVPPSSADDDATTLPPAPRSPEESRTRDPDVESVPPSSVDLPTLPPSPLARSAPVDQVPPNADAERIPPSDVQLPDSAPWVESEPPSSMTPRRVAAVANLGASASAKKIPPAFPVSPAVASSAVDPEIVADAHVARGVSRRAGNRKIVGYVVGGAGAVAIVGVILRLLSGSSVHHDESKLNGPARAPAALTSGASATAVAPDISAVPVASALPLEAPTQGEPSAEPTSSPSSETVKALPTSAPTSAAAARPTDSAVRKPGGNARKAFRPTGI